MPHMAFHASKYNRDAVRALRFVLRADQTSDDNNVNNMLFHVISFFCRFGMRQGESLVHHMRAHAIKRQPLRELLRLCPSCFQNVSGIC